MALVCRSCGNKRGLDASMSAMGLGEITRDELNEWMAKDPELYEL